MNYKDYYKIMGLSESASQDEIKRAYRKLARKYHPDVSKESNAENNFKELGEAYEVLKDPEKRKRYDQLGKQWQQGEDFTPPEDWNRDFNFKGGGFTDANTTHFSDFFESLFGHQGAGFRQPAHQGVIIPGQDQHAKITITLEESYHGTNKTIQLQLPELNKEGQISTRLRTLNTKIPAGIIEGQQIRLKGQGGAGIGGGKQGDLYLEIVLAPHAKYNVNGKSIYLTLPVAPWEAALGATIPVPTLGGPVNLVIPVHAQSGKKLRLGGRGLPGKPPGDQFVTLQVVLPQAKNKDQQAIYREMAEKMNFDPRAGLEV